jgi:hypothetical protein
MREEPGSPDEGADVGTKRCHGTRPPESVTRESHTLVSDVNVAALYPNALRVSSGNRPPALTLPQGR